MTDVTATQSKTGSTEWTFFSLFLLQLTIQPFKAVRYCISSDELKYLIVKK